MNFMNDLCPESKSKVNKYSAQNWNKAAAAGKREVDGEWSQDVQQENLV